MTDINDHRYEGLDSCLHGTSIYEPCLYCGRTEEDIELYYKEFNEQFERYGM